MSYRKIEIRYVETEGNTKYIIQHKQLRIFPNINLLLHITIMFINVLSISFFIIHSSFCASSLLLYRPFSFIILFHSINTSTCTVPSFAVETATTCHTFVLCWQAVVECGLNINDRYIVLIVYIASDYYCLNKSR